ncbi:MAG: hypothetical protein KatS3mg126_2145 [Lysobacteraceae bacterium]|nr:MAG: hypothetical protein KatS3mg126_2145 [Xanthomonadaceae bacterium]
MESFEVLERLRRQPAPVPAPDSAEERLALEGFKAFFSSFQPDRVDRLLPATYAEDVYFNDTLKTVRGREALARYLRESAAAVEDCRVEVIEASRIRPGEFWLRWQMMIRFRRFARGRDTFSIGASHLRFDAAGKVAYQQDYWNAAEGLFRHIPLLGWMITAIQRRL